MSLQIVFVGLFAIACIGLAYYFLIYKKPSTSSGICPGICSGICLNSCKNGGTWNAETKSCSCTDKFIGIDCGVDKKDANPVCGFHSDIEFPTGKGCGYGSHGSDDNDMITNYCNFLKTPQSNDWFKPPGHELQTFGIYTETDYGKLCDSPEFLACSPNVQAKGLQTIFQKYSKRQEC